MILKSKTSCFTIAQIALTMVKDGFLESKTTCFTTLERDDINVINIILHNNQIHNELNNIMTLITKRIIQISSMTSVRASKPSGKQALNPDMVYFYKI